MKRTTITLTALALMLTACGAGEVGGSTTSPDASTPDTTTAPLPAPEEVRMVLTISDEGGFIPVEWNFKRVPRYVLMSDGTLYGPGMVTAIYPGPALPVIQAVTLSDEAMSEIMALIDASALGEVVDERNDRATLNVADLPDTVFTFVDEDGEVHRFSVYALGFEGVDFEDDRIAGLEDLLARIDQAMIEGEPAPEPVIETVEVFAGVREIPVEAEFRNTLDWPLDMEFDDMADAGAGFRCATLEGTEAQAILDLFADAKETTTVLTEAGDEYTLIVRPLLPGQNPSC
jgi:hypothetical protein